jgi:hypothetical protein
MSGLLKERRRVHTSGFYGTIYAFRHLPALWNVCSITSGHSLWRRFTLSLQFLYNVVSTTLMWFSFSFLYLTLYVIIKTNATIQLDYPIMFPVALMLYHFLFLLQLVLGMGNRPEQVQHLYQFCTLIYFIMVTISTMMLLNVLPYMSYFTNLCAAGVVASFLAGGLIQGEVFHLLISGFQYFMLFPSFINIFTIFSLCKITSEGEAKLDAMRSKVLVSWILCNGAAIYFVTDTWSKILRDDTGEIIYTNIGAVCAPGWNWLDFIIPVAAGYQGLRFSGSLIFILSRLFQGWDFWAKSTARKQRAIEQKAAAAAGAAAAPAMLALDTMGQSFNPGASIEMMDSVDNASHGIRHVHHGAAHRDESTRGKGFKRAGTLDGEEQVGNAFEGLV